MSNVLQQFGLSIVVKTYQATGRVDSLPMDELPQKVPLFVPVQVAKDCLYSVCFDIISVFMFFQYKVWNKEI